MEKVMQTKVARKMLDNSLGEDNPPCIREAMTHTVSYPSRHIYIKYQFIVDNVNEGKVRGH